MKVSIVGGGWNVPAISSNPLSFDDIGYHIWAYTHPYGCPSPLRPFQFLSVFRITVALQNLSVSQEKKKKS